MLKKFPICLSIVFLSLSSVSAFGQDAEQPVYAKPSAPVVEQAPAAIEPQPAPTAEQPVYTEQPATVAEQPAAVEPQPVYAEQTPVATPQQDSTQTYVEPYEEPAPAYEPPQQTYVQGYGKPPEGFYGYFGYPPSETQNCASPENAKEKEADYKILHSFNISIPIESETYSLKSPSTDVDASHFGVGINWNRFRVEESLYSSVVGFGFNYVMSEWDGGGSENIKYNGMDINFKFGFGISPLADRFILAIHAFMGFDYKMQNAVFKQKLSDLEFFGNFGSISGLDDLDYTLELKHKVFSLDLQLGGDLIFGYQITKSFGVLAGVDISHNMIGIGLLTEKSDLPDGLDKLEQFEDFDEGDDLRFFTYALTGLNIVPRIGIFFAF